MNRMFFRLVPGTAFTMGGEESPPNFEVECCDNSSAFVADMHFDELVVVFAGFADWHG